MNNTVHLVGNAHIDPVWLWRWQEGYAEIKASFRSALDRIAEFPGFIFTSACAAYYKWVEENDPEMFSEIQRRVSEGRWQIVGGMWIQPDCNVPSGESFARHFLLSQRYFQERFGCHATVGYNVDSFGHNGSLPKLLQGAGINSYVMMRPDKSENPEMPEGIFWWEAGDGSRVLTFRIRGPYNNSFSDSEGKRILQYLEDSDRLEQPVLCLYGVGNHGGGPTVSTLKRIAEYQAGPDGNRLELSHPRRFFDETGRTETSKIPVWKADLQWHASGCYSAMSEIKKNNRRAENRMVQAEVLSSLAGVKTGYAMPDGLMNRAWERVLFNQFHDIMGGCSLREAYDDARELHGQALSIAAEVVNAAAQSLSWNIGTTDARRSLRSKERDWSLWELDGMGTPVVVFNSLAWRREIPVQLGRPVQRIETHEGTPVPVQTVRASRTNGRDKWDKLFMANVPAMGYAVYWAYLGEQEERLYVTDLLSAENTIENEFLRLTIDAENGLIASLYDKLVGREVFAGAAGTPWVVNIEHCDTWAHKVFEFRDVCGRFEKSEVVLLESGPVRAKLRVRSVYGSSSLTQDYILYAGSREVLIEVRLDWREEFKMLKLAFPVTVWDGFADYDIPFGSIRRSARGTEESGQMWFDVGNGSYGLSILNDGKYSFDVLDNEMRMTVANGSLYADHFSGENRDGLGDFLDQGIQRFSYVLRPRAGARGAETVRAALALNTEETHVNETYHEGCLPQISQGISLSVDNVIATTLKPAYDGNGYILRLCEYEGRDTRVEVSLSVLDMVFTAHLPPNAVRSYRIPRGGGAVRPCDFREEDLL